MGNYFAPQQDQGKRNPGSSGNENDREWAG